MSKLDELYTEIEQLDKEINTLKKSKKKVPTKKEALYRQRLTEFFAEAAKTTKVITKDEKQ